MSSQAAVTSAFAARISRRDAALPGCTSRRKQREIAGCSLMSDSVAPTVVTAPSGRDLMQVNRRNARCQYRLAEMSVAGRRRGTLASRMPTPFTTNANSPTMARRGETWADWKSRRAPIMSAPTPGSAV
jgi:hypothetical protein